VILVENKFFFGVSVLALLLLTMVAVAAPQYAQTTVYFNVPETLSFTVTLPSYAANTSNTTEPAGAPVTVNIEFNATTGDSNAQPCIQAGAATCQTGATLPIFQYDNTGNANMTIQLRFSSALPSGITVCVNSTAQGTGNQATHHTACYDVNNSLWAIVVQNLSSTGSNLTNATLYANFSGISPGTSSNRRLDHNGSRTVGS